MKTKIYTYTYTDCSKPLPHWPFWGEFICEIESDCILKADEIFKKSHPDKLQKNGNLGATISVSIKTKQNPA
jgi:hypothetical protein